MSINWSMFVSAIGLLFVFEGIMPFLSPTFYRHVMQQMMFLSDRILRSIGFASMLIGLMIVFIVHQF
ncbi:MAG: hypothetical protein A3F42_03925 [Gammaproteobacteria bacterium RIFCSPHIGHO2_12_FULL_37_34]|nr:MAG: hypothetical protein A3F42_03925 [Gammaproteobacteria bacterium RIFCSPHIGHO2_12_FULL_37_34]